jgi:RNA polymerase sigma-70 factor (ECF subfamily)
MYVHSRLTEVADEVRTGVVECMPHLRAFARSLTSNRALADDLVHDAIVRALTAAQQYTPGTNFKAWIFTILRNLYYNEGRKRAGRFSSIDDLGHNEPMIGASQEANLEFCDFRRAFKQLNPDQREVLMLVGASGLSYEEAAAVCGCAVGTVKSRASRARQDLKRLLGGMPLPTARTELGPVAGRDPIALLTFGTSVDR